MAGAPTPPWLVVFFSNMFFGCAGAVLGLRHGAFGRFFDDFRGFFDGFSAVFYGFARFLHRFAHPVALPAGDGRRHTLPGLDGRGL